VALGIPVDLNKGTNSICKEKIRGVAKIKQTGAGGRNWTERLPIRFGWLAGPGPPESSKLRVPALRRSGHRNLKNVSMNGRSGVHKGVGNYTRGETIAEVLETGQINHFDVCQACEILRRAEP